jgi:hypothetical protein
MHGMFCSTMAAVGGRALYIFYFFSIFPYRIIFPGVLEYMTTSASIGLTITPT